MITLEVYEMKEHHIESCVQLFMETFSKEPWNDEYESTEEVRNYFFNFFKSDVFLGFIGEYNGEIIALSLGMKKPWLKGIEYYIDQFCVAWELQGQGIGSQFLDKIKERLNRYGMNGILLNTERGYPAYDFYKKNEFQELEELVLLGWEL